MAKGKTWTLQELTYLSNNYEFGKSKEIAGKLGRSVIAIREKARRLGLAKNERTVFINGVYEESVSNRLEIEGKINMKNYKLEVNQGDEVLVLTSDYNKKEGKRRKIKGRVIYRDDDLITVAGKNYNESFTFKELYCKDAELIKEGQAWN